MMQRLAFVSLTLTACMIDEPPLSEVVAAASKTPGDGCTTWGCGSNSPAVDKLGFHELEELGATNREGFRIARFEILQSTGYRVMRADVQNGELLARDLSGAVIAKGTQLLHARFTLTRREGTVSTTYMMYVDSVGEMALWVAPVQTHIYRLTWSGPSTGAHRLDVCADPGASTDVPTFHAVLFDDDRIDADSLLVTSDVASNWFNIGCAGHTLAKQYLTGNTKASSALAHIERTVDARTASLKMISADYCGQGDPFTVAGTDLHWRDRDDKFSTVNVGEQVEAMWNAHGAICVNKPRVEYSPTTASMLAFPDGLGAELAAFGCVLPAPCTREKYDTKYSMSGAYMLSTNY